MPIPFLIPAIMAGIGALGGALNNKAKTNTQTQTQDSTTKQNSSTSANYGETELDVRNNILRQLLGATEDTTNFAEGATNAGIQGINATDAARRRMQQSMITSRGLGRTTAGVNALAQGDQFRQGQVNQLMAQMPYQQEKIRSDRLGDLSRFFATLPVGMNTNSTSTTNATGTGTQITPGNVAGGALSSGASIAALLYGMGGFGGGAKPGMAGVAGGGTYGGAASPIGLSGMLGS